LTTKFTQHTRITPVEPSQTYKVFALLFCYVSRRSALRFATRHQQRHS